MLVQVRLDLRQERWAQSMCALDMIIEALEEAIDDMPRRMTGHVARSREIEC